MADGSIRIDTTIGTKEAEADLMSLEKMCDDTKKHIQGTASELGMKTNPYEVTSDKELLKTEKRLEEIRKKIEEIQADTDKMLPQAATDSQAQNLLDFEESQTKQLIEEQTLLTQAADTYRQKQTEITAEKQRQKEIDAAKKQEQTDVKAINTGVSNQMAAQDFVSKIKSAEEYEAAITRVKARMQEIEAQTARLAAEKGINAGDALKTNKEYQKLRAQMDALTSSTRKFKSTSSDSFGSARKSASQVTDSLKAGIKQIAKYTLAIFGARSAFFAVKNAIRQVLADNEQLNNTVTAMKGVFASAIEPVVERIVYYLQYAMAYLNLFIKTITGVDLVANYNAKALNKQAEATKKAGKAAKEAQAQLASFDEMNVFNSTSANEVDTSAIEAAAATLNLPDVSDGKFAEICETIKAHLYELETVAAVAMIAVGLILLACGQIAMGIACILAGVYLAAQAIGNSDKITAQSKKLIKNILDIGGDLLLVIGIILCAFGVSLPIGIACILGGITAKVVGEAINTGDLKTAISNTMNDIKEFLISYCLIGLGATLILTIGGLPLGIKLIEKGLEKMQKENLVPDRIMTIISNVFETIKGILKGGFEVVFGVILCLCPLTTPLGIALIKEGLKTIKSVTIDKEWVRNLVESAWTSVKNFWNSNIKPVFTKEWWTNKLNAIAQGARGAMNAAISYIEKGINWMVQQINRISFKIPDFVKPWGGAVVGFNLSYVSIPRLAKGAIVNNPGAGVFANLGENGPEAVLPLVNNTEWMDILADKINGDRSGNIIVRVYLDGKEISAKVRTEEQRFAFATNGGVL